VSKHDPLFSSGGAKGKKDSFSACYHTHPPLKLPGGLTIYGGGAHNPVVKDGEVYLALEGSSAKGMKPWLLDSGPLHVAFPIIDRHAPKDPEEFKLMIDWLCNQLHAGKKVHVGCIGGHGRTGTVLSAVVAKLGEKDAITYVRNNYCHKAVESEAQVDFLVQYYGVKKVAKSDKSGSYDDEGWSKGTTTGRYSGMQPNVSNSKATYASSFNSKYVTVDDKAWEIVQFGQSKKSLWSPHEPA
jgi:hypothetical protein